MGSKPFVVPALCVSLVVNGSLAMHTFNQNKSATAATAKVESLEAALRKKTSQLYDLQEGQNDVLEAAQGEASVWKWKFEQCMEAKK